MYALATCTASILRGSTEDEFGQEVDSNVVIAYGVLAQITEQGLTVQEPNSLTPRTVRNIRGIVPSGTDIRPSDLLRDNRSNFTYLVVEVVKPGGPAYTRDIELQLRKVD